MTFEITLINHTSGTPLVSSWYAESAECLLDSGLRAGEMLRYSCRGGACGSCQARLLAGEVQQNNQAGLTQKEIDSGHILLCQSNPLSDLTILIKPPQIFK